jgi:hypothetical protein
MEGENKKERVGRRGEGREEEKDGGGEGEGEGEEERDWERVETSLCRQDRKVNFKRRVEGLNYTVEKRGESSATKNEARRRCSKKGWWECANVQKCIQGDKSDN